MIFAKRPARQRTALGPQGPAAPKALRASDAVPAASASETSRLGVVGLAHTAAGGPRRESNPTAVATRVAVEGRLSGREGEVLVAAAQGMCTKQIALSLGISGKTVDYFWKRIFKKLGCASHEEVMALLLRRACSGGSALPRDGRVE